jgi:hypothetical protein
LATVIKDNNNLENCYDQKPMTHLKQKEFHELTDQEPIEAKKLKPTPVLDAFFIGFLVGILIYSLAANSWGFLTLIPLFIIYRLLKKSKNNAELKKDLKERKVQ